MLTQASYFLRHLFADKTTIIFDFDGTIADTFCLHEKAFQQALKEYKLQFNYADYTGRSTNEAIQLIFNSNKIPVSKGELSSLVKEKRRLANQFYKEEIKFIPGAFSFIKLLYSKKFQLYVGSSGSKMNVTTGMETLDISKYFQGIITADDVVNSKPHPEIFQTVISKYKIPASAALIIEDALSGIQAAEAAGIDVISIDKTIQPGINYSIKFVQADFIELSQFLTDEHR